MTTTTEAAPGAPASPPTGGPLAGRREWIGLAVLALACLLYVMDLTVLHLAVPSISRDLRPSSAQLLWIIDIYGFMVAGFLITMGTLGDRIGRRKLLLTGAAAFGVVSVIAAFSTSAEMLIASRALLGVAGATLAPSTLSVIFGLKQIAQDGVGWLAVSSILVGLAVGFLWIRRQLTLADPMIDLRLFRIPSFSASLVVNFLTIFMAIGYFLFVAQYLQLVLGLSPLAAGLWSVPSAVGFIVGSNIAPRIVRLVRPAYVIGASLALAALGLVVLTRVGGSHGLAVVVIGSVVIALGLAPVLTLTTDLIVGSAPPERAGAASGISETAVELGGALGISVLGSLGVAIYRGDLAHLPAGLSADATATARDTLGGAVKVAALLPDSLGLAGLDE